jgi:hypothetical protein
LNWSAMAPCPFATTVRGAVGEGAVGANAIATAPTAKRFVVESALAEERRHTARSALLRLLHPPQLQLLRLPSFPHRGRFHLIISFRSGLHRISPFLTDTHPILIWKLVRTILRWCYQNLVSNPLPLPCRLRRLPGPCRPHNPRTRRHHHPCRPRSPRPRRHHLRRPHSPRPRRHHRFRPHHPRHRLHRRRTRRLQKHLSLCFVSGLIACRKLSLRKVFILRARSETL